MLKFDRIYAIPCDPFAFPFINRHKGRFHDVIHCYNLGKKGRSSIRNERLSYTIGTIGLTRLTRLVTLARFDEPSIKT